jgi:hypothetical protein
MSGPKTSRYTLTAEQRRLLQEQRALEGRKAVAAERIQRITKRLRQIGGQFQADQQIAAELAARTGHDGGFDDALHDLEQLIASIQPTLERADRRDVTAVEQAAEEAQECLSRANGLANDLSALSAENERLLKDILRSAIAQGSSASFADIEATGQTSSASRKDAVMLQLEQWKQAPALPKGYLDEIETALTALAQIADEEFLKNFIALSVQPLAKKVKQFLAEYEDCHEAFESLQAEYAALCRLYGYVAQEYPCSPASIPALQAEIQRIQHTAAQNDEQTYIRDCLDEVMEEMGYSVLGSREVTKKSGVHFRNELYPYGDGTAVSITYSSDGRIAMELGWLDTQDRLPSAQEATDLCHSMEHFCQDFQAIEARLLEKGVVPADRISLLPPDPAYAQVINASDYDVGPEAVSAQKKKTRRSHTERSTRQREG